MAETTNYGLYLESDSTTKFQEWREKINGVNDSNMVKIDTALGEKAQASVAVSATLLASAWIGVDNPFTQTIAVAEIKSADDNGSISVAQSATFEQRQAARLAQLCITEQGAGYIVVSADNEMPDIDIPVTIILIG